MVKGDVVVTGGANACTEDEEDATRPRRRNLVGFVILLFLFLFLLLFVVMVIKIISLLIRLDCFLKFVIQTVH